MPIKPMLAKPFNKKWMKGDIYLQPKLDGMRAVWDGQKLYSRRGKEIKGVPTLVEYLREHYPTFPLDGELYNHNKSFQEQISSVRKTVNIDEDLSIEYHVYDYPVEDLPFKTRQARLRAQVESIDPDEISRVKVVETHWIPQKAIEQYLPNINPYEQDGYEGTMVRNAEGLYKAGKRSSDLMKVKTFQDEEFRCVGHYQLTRKEKIIVPEGTPGSLPYADGTWYKDGEETADEMIGGLVCQTNGSPSRTFEIGTGYDEETRRQLWANPPLNKLITIKFQEYTDPDEDGVAVPRFPVFKGIRIEEDLPEEE